MPQRYRIITTDNHATLRAALITILEGTGEFEVAGEAADGAQLLELLQKGIAADAVVLDLMMPVMTGIEAATEIRKMGLDIKILILTMRHETELLCRAFRAGASGYVLKDGISTDLLPALHAVIEGRLYISPGIKTELPETCNVKHIEGQARPLEFVHCT